MVHPGVARCCKGKWVRVRDTVLLCDELACSYVPPVIRLCWEKGAPCDQDRDERHDKQRRIRAAAPDRHGHAAETISGARRRKPWLDVERSAAQTYRHRPVSPNPNI